MPEEEENLEEAEDAEALEEAVSGDAEGDEESMEEDASAGESESGEGEELDPLAQEMLQMMEDDGAGEDQSEPQEDVDRMMEMEMLKAMEQEGGGGAAGIAPGAAGAVAEEGGGKGGLPPNIARLMDVSMVVSIVLGRTQKTLEEVMGLSEQSLVELDKSVGDPVDIMVNGRLFARGEVVTVTENFGVRITELVSTPAEMM